MGSIAQGEMSKGPLEVESRGSSGEGMSVCVNQSSGGEAEVTEETLGSELKESNRGLGPSLGEHPHCGSVGNRGDSEGIWDKLIRNM